MTVFHGSYMRVPNPEVKRGRARVENGDITAEQALGQLAYKKVNHQVAILNQRIVEACLHYVNSEELVDAR